MKRYPLFRVLRSILSIFLVTTLTYTVIYSLVPRKTIFQNDVNYGKLKAKPDELADCENTTLSKMGYIEYHTTEELKKEVGSNSSEKASSEQLEEKYQDWAKKNGWTLKQSPIGREYYAAKNIPLVERVVNFYANVIQIGHPWKVKGASNPNLKHSLRIENDELVGWALVGSGTQYKYQIYFNGQFPYTHQNIVHLNLGASYPTFAGQAVTSILSGGQGKAESTEITFNDDFTARSSANIYLRQYQKTENISPRDRKYFSDNYVTTDTNYQGLSMIGTSFRMGTITVVTAYAIGTPAAMLMARYKGKIPDKAGIAIVTVLISVPSLAFIYFFRFIGSSWFSLPDPFPALDAQDICSYILPTVISGLLSVSRIVIWLRRYMIDQQSSDHVKFAKAKGLNAKGIAKKYIFRNVATPIVNGIPGSIIGAITGATITETVFAAPGMGKMLPDAIIIHNNPLVIAIVLVFAAVSVFSILAGDIAMALVDPRIKLSSGGR